MQVQPRFNLPEMAQRKSRRRVSGVAIPRIGVHAFYRMELRAGMQKIINVWAEAGRDLKPLTHGSGLIQDDRSDDIEETIRRFILQSEVLLLSLTAAIPALIGRVEHVHSVRWSNAIKRALGIDIAPFIAPVTENPTIRAHQAWATGLLKDFNDDAQRKLSGIVRAGVARRAPAREISKEIEKAFGVLRSRADLIASDQANKLSGSLDEVRHREAGIDVYRWRHSGKVNFRANHLAREGKIYRWDRPPSGGHPRSEINCACTAQAWIALDEDIETPS